MGCYNSKIINASEDKVWSALRDFHRLDWAKGVVETVEAIGPKVGDQIGARRKVNGAFTETLLCLDDQSKVIRYSIDDGPGPLQQCSGYVGQVRLAPVTDGDRTFIEWSSSWQDSGGGVKEFCDPVYKGLLDALAAHFG
jgi:carbon monoxide dehydrogenase subunit G